MTARPSERDVVLHDLAHAAAAAAGTGRLGQGRAAILRGAAAIVATALLVVAAGTAAAGPAVEHRQHRIEALEHDLGGIAVLARLVLPFARLQLAFQIDLGPLPEILLGNLAQPLAEDDDAVPLRLLPPLAGVAIAPVLRGGDAQIGDRLAVLGAADLRIGAEIADQNDLVDAA